MRIQTRPVKVKINTWKLLRSLTLPTYLDISDIAMQSKSHTALYLSRTKFCRTLICARETLSSSCAFADPLTQFFFPWPRFGRDVSLLCSVDATASRIYRCLSRIFDAPIGFAQRISHPSFSTMLFDSKTTLMLSKKIMRVHYPKLRWNKSFGHLKDNTSHYNLLHNNILIWW